MTQRRRRQATPRLVTLAAPALAMLIAGCHLIGGDVNLGRTITLENTGEVAVEVLSVRDGTESTLVTLDPGQTFTINAALYPDGCYPDLLVARTADGLEVARLEEQLCEGNLWGFGTMTAPS